MSKKAEDKALKEMEEAFKLGDFEKINEIRDIMSLIEIKEKEEELFEEVNSLVLKGYRICGIVAGLSLVNVLISGNPLWLATNVMQIPCVKILVKSRKLRNTQYLAASNGTVSYKRYKRLKKSGALNVYIEQQRKMIEKQASKKMREISPSRYREEEAEEQGWE